MKILLADDHALIRSGLRIELVALAAEIEFVEAWDAASLRERFAQHRDLDLALVDLSMPGMNGSDTIAAMRADFPLVPLVVVSGNEGAASVQSALRAGASGFIPKSAVAQLVLPAIRLVLAGGQYLPPQSLGIAQAPVVGALPANGIGTGAASMNATPNVGARPHARGHSGRLQALSPRQREVFGLLAKGLSNKMIARELNISEGTVKSHVATIFDVLQVHNRVSAVAEARLLADEISR